MAASIWLSWPSGKNCAAEQVLVRPGRLVLKQVADADHDDGQQQAGGDPRTGRHRAKQVADLGNCLVQEIHPWTSSRERGARS